MTPRECEERAIAYYQAGVPPFVEADEDPDQLARLVFGIDTLIETLNHQEQVVLRLRFGLTKDEGEHTLKACGGALGVGKNRARVILECALAKLRRHQLLHWAHPEAEARMAASHRHWAREKEARHQAREREREEHRAQLQARERERLTRWPPLDVEKERKRYYREPHLWVSDRSLDNYLQRRALETGLAASIDRGVKRYFAERASARPVDKESA